MLLGASGEGADMGPSGVPEEDQATFDEHVGYPHQVPFPAVTGIEGSLDLLSFAHGLVQHEFLGVVSSVALLCHENLSLCGFVEIRSISSLPDAGQPFLGAVFLFTSCREGASRKPGSSRCKSPRSCGTSASLARVH